eukprot:COSAG01_NODE_615_length_14818_cov_9.454039_1_plen_149_part_10
MDARQQQHQSSHARMSNWCCRCRGWQRPRHARWTCLYLQTAVLLHASSGGAQAQVCLSGSGDRAGYEIWGQQLAVTVAGLGSITCAPGYGGGTPTVTCPAWNGPFVFSGCVDQCTVGSGNRTGYIITNANANTQVGMGAVTCAQSYSGT